MLLLITELKVPAKKVDDQNPREMKHYAGSAPGSEV
jgi:hypothetical protein